MSIVKVRNIWKTKKHIWRIVYRPWSIFMQIQELCGWVKPENYKPKRFTVYVSCVLQRCESVWERKSWSSVFPCIWIPSCIPRGTSKFWLSLSETVCVWVCGHVERAQRKMMFSFNRGGQRSDISTVISTCLDSTMIEIIKLNGTQMLHSTNAAQMQHMHTSTYYKNVFLSESLCRSFMNFKV